MPFCQCPQNDIFSINGKCGKKISPNNELHLCDYHLNILYKAPPNPIKAFPPSCLCLICNSYAYNSVYDNSICCQCLTKEDSKQISLKSLIKCFNKNPNLIYSCDNKIIIILKTFLVNFDTNLPNNFEFNIDFNTKNKLTISIDNHKIKDYTIDKYFNLSMTDLLITYL